MNFQQELATRVMAGAKTVTRRLTSENERSPWYEGGCSLTVGRDYAVCPGRGKDQIGRVRVTAVTLEFLGWLGDGEARLEGFPNGQAFQDAWERINGSYDPMALVWRVEFERLPVGSVAA